MISTEERRNAASTMLVTPVNIVTKRHKAKCTAIRARRASRTFSTQPTVSLTVSVHGTRGSISLTLTL